MPAEVVGRERELESVAGFLDELEHVPAVLSIEGEAGIGKTTLWIEAVRAAEARGYRVLEARPAPSDVKLSYAALADLVGAVFEQCRGALPDPQERGLAAALLVDDSGEPVDARATAAGVVAMLNVLAVERAVVVAVDDVQWLDAASERALAFVAQRLPPRCGLLLTSRSEPGAAAPLGLDHARPDARIDRVVPGPLSLAALHHVIVGRLGAALPRPQLTRLAAASGGNPFFALEIARALAAGEALRSLSEPLPVPPSLKELVGLRLGGLSRATREALFVAATLARPTVAILAAACAPELDGEAAIGEAEDAGVVVCTAGRVRFTHPLLGSAVYGSASEVRRRRWHRLLADIVADPEERALHLARGTTEMDERVADEVEAGARQTAHRGAQDAAAQLFEAAARLTPADRADALARRMLGQASALNAVGDFAEARALGERAVASARTPAVLAQGRSLLATLAWFAGEAGVATDHLERALAAVGEDRELQGPIYAKLVRFNFTLDFERAAENAEIAIHLLESEREPLLLAHVLIDRFFAGAMLGQRPSRKLLDRGVELETKALPTSSQAPHPIPLLWFGCTDEADAARTRYAIEDDWYRERGEDVWRANRRAHLAPVELRAGNWKLAERHVEESCAALEHLEVGGPMALVFEKRALVDAHRGRIDRARATLSRLIEEYERMGQAYWATLALSTLAFTEFAAGDHAATDQALTRMHAHADALGLKDIPHDRSEPFHVESLLALGERDRAHEVLTRLEDRHRLLPRLWTTITLPRTRALVLGADGDLTGALAALGELDGNLAAGLPLEGAWTLLVKGRLLRRAKHKGAAAAALKQAAGIFAQLGALPWRDRAQSELRRVGLRPSAPDRLTESERRVAELAATGLTNLQVAAELYMSPKTVEANLSRVYRKLGIRSRAELGAKFAGTESPPAQT